MRIALTLAFTLTLTGTVAGTALAQDADATAPAVAPLIVQPTNPQLPVTTPPPVPSVAPHVLSANDVTLYRQLFAAAAKNQTARIKTLSAKVDDRLLLPYVEATRLAETKKPKIKELVAWLAEHRDLAAADRIYRLAVANSTKTIRRKHKTIKVAVVTNIPAPVTVGRRTGGYEDLELPEPVPSSEAGRAILAAVLSDIKSGTPDGANARLDNLKSQATATASDIAILSHRIAASYLAEGLDAQAYQLAGGVADVTPCPQLDWDAGFAAYRLGQWADAAAHLERLAQNGAVQGTLRAQAAFWAARAHMQSGDPQKVVSLLAAAAKEEPTFYGLIAERMLGIDSATGFSDPVLSQADYVSLMAEAPAKRAVALWQVGQDDYVGPELNHAFVDNDERLDPAMAALARDLGVTNVELRASEKSVSHGLLLTGLFPVPPYQPTDGYHVDSSLVLAFARIESRFQNGATSPVGARGIMQIMPATAARLGGSADALYDPGYALSLGQRYIAQLLDRLDGNLVKLGGAYNAGPGAVDRWTATKAGKDDPILFIESIPVAETRSYVKRLMEYHWMYRRRFGEEAKTLDDLASGAWPVYRPDAATPASVMAAPVLPPTQVSDARKQ